MRCRTAIAVVLTTCTCGTPNSVPTGLVRQSQATGDASADHLGKFVTVGDAILVANSNDALTVVRNGKFAVTMVTSSFPELKIRCTTIEVHAPTNTLFCASDIETTVHAFDVSQPTQPRYRGPVLSEPDMVVSDLAVIGDYLWLSRFGQGLSRAKIDSAGTLSNHQHVYTTSHVRKVAPYGEDLVALTGDRGLVGLKGDSEASDVSEVGEVTEVAEVWQHPLSGPALDLAIRGDRAVVALGSQGAVVLDLGTEPPQQLAHLTPHGVATSADTHGDTAAVATLTGLFYYDLRAPNPRLAGFEPSGDWGHNSVGSMLFARFHGDALLVSDWKYISRFSANPNGEVTRVDFERSVYTNANTPIRWSAFNPSALDLEVAFSIADTHLLSAVLPAGEVSEFVTDEFERFASDRVTRIDAELSYGGASLSEDAVFIYPTSARDPTRVGKPAPGMVFPPVRLIGDAPGERVDLPFAQRQRVIFYTPDCVAMWPQLEDAAFLAREGRLDAGAIPVLVGNAPLYSGQEHTQFGQRFRLDGAVYGRTNDPPPDVAAINQPLEPVYEHGFWIEHLPSGAHHPTDYVVDANGTVLAVERQYRGAYPLHRAR